MLEETTPRTSAAWRPHTTYAADMGAVDKTGKLAVEVREDAQHDKTESLKGNKNSMA